MASGVVDELLNDILHRLDHLNVEGQIMEMELVNASGSSCDIYTGYLNVGIRRVKVAVKKLRIYTSNEPVIVKKLAKEAYIWSKLKHENILPLTGFFLGKDRLRSPHFVSMWMKTGTLLDYLKVPALMRGKETIRMAEGIAAGMSYLHSKGIIHADLKSPNILISDSEHPLITDFGVSYIMAGSVTVMCGTTARSMKGTVRWSAIELFSPSGDSDSVSSTEKSDVWAFGMVLYELLTHKLPYESLKHDAQVISAVVQGTVPDAPSFDTASLGLLERELWDVCRACWAREPGLRPTMGTVHDLIKTLLPYEYEEPYLTFEEQSSAGLIGSQVAIGPAQGDWFATYDPFVEPEKQLTIDLIHTFSEASVSQAANNLFFSWDGRWFANDLRDESGIILIYDTRTCELAHSLSIAAKAPSHFSPLGRLTRINANGEYLVVAWYGEAHSESQIWDIGTDTIRRSFHNVWVMLNKSYPETVAIYDAMSLTIEIQEVTTARVVRTLSLSSLGISETSDIHTYNISADTELFAAESREGRVYVWSISSGIRKELVASIYGDASSDTQGHSHLLFTSDEHFLVRLVRTQEECHLDFWDVSEFDRKSPSHIRSLSLSPETQARWEICPFLSQDGQWLIEAVENRIYFRDIQTSQSRLMLQGHNEPVTWLFGSPHGGLLATTSTDGTTKLWKYAPIL